MTKHRRIAAIALAGLALTGAAIGTGGCSAGSEKADAAKAAPEWTGADMAAAKMLIRSAPTSFASICRESPSEAFMIREGKHYLGGSIVRAGGSITPTLRAMWSRC